MAGDPYDLARFVAAQDAPAGGSGDTVHDRALAELRAGSKRTHWMWFVFPQLSGLGRSTTARHYAISGLAEARAYLAHPVLGPRLGAAASVVAGLAAGPQDVFGPVDALKLHSSATLFLRAADAAPQPFAAVLDRHFAGEPDAATDRLLDTPVPGGVIVDPRMTR